MASVKSEHHQHLHLLHVVGVSGDQRRGTEAGDLPAGEGGDTAEEGGADVAAEPHGRASSQVYRGNRAGDLQQRDGKHPAAHPHDVSGVAEHDAVIDDIGVQAG